MSNSFIEIAIKLFFPTLFVGLCSYIIYLVKNTYDQKTKNTLNEIRLEGEEIKVENSKKPIDQLINDSNTEHGVLPTVGQGSGDDIKKK